MCSKHVEARNKTYCETKILCIKLVKYWDKYTEMQHGQQNVKICTIPCRGRLYHHVRRRFLWYAYLSPTGHYLSPTGHYLSPTGHYLSPTAHYSACASYSFERNNSKKWCCDRNTKNKIEKFPHKKPALVTKSHEQSAFLARHAPNFYMFIIFVFF